MDIYDQATVQEELMRDLAIKAERARLQKITPVGTCHSCDAIVNEPKLFCDSDCRDDWQMRQGVK